MIVTTGPIVVGRPPGRLAPPQTALDRLGRRRAPGRRVKQTVTLTLTPAAVASSIAPIPAAVAGNFTMMFGARPPNRTPWASIRSGVRKSVGSVWTDRRPCATAVGREGRFEELAPRGSTSRRRSPRRGRPPSASGPPRRASRTRSRHAPGPAATRRPRSSGWPSHRRRRS